MEMQKKMVMRVDECTQKHVRVTFFSGMRGDSLANIGQLCMTIGDYQLMSTVLSMGAEATKGYLELEHRDKVFVDWSNENEV